MPIKLDKRRRRRPTILKQKQKQVQKQHVVINLGDLMKKHRPRAKPLVPPKPKQPSEMIITRVIHPYTPPPYQHTVQPPVKVTTAGIEPPKYIPESYKPKPAFYDRLFKMGEQPSPLPAGPSDTIEKEQVKELEMERVKLNKHVKELEMEQEKLNKGLDDAAINRLIQVEERLPPLSPPDDQENPLIQKGKATKEQMKMRGFRTEQLIKQHEKLGTPSPSKRQMLDHLKKIEFEERLKDKLKRI